MTDEELARIAAGGVNAPSKLPPLDPQEGELIAPGRQPTDRTPLAVHLARDFQVGGHSCISVNGKRRDLVTLLGGATER